MQNSKCVDSGAEQVEFYITYLVYDNLITTHVRTMGFNFYNDTLSGCNLIETINAK